MGRVVLGGDCRNDGQWGKVKSRRSWAAEKARGGKTMENYMGTSIQECSDGYLQMGISSVDLHVMPMKIGGMGECLLNECMTAYTIPLWGCVCVCVCWTPMNMCIEETEGSLCKGEGTPGLP